jgi:uncharacterized membrane protein YoaK (UPF0700 family)
MSIETDKQERSRLISVKEATQPSVARSSDSPTGLTRMQIWAVLLLAWVAAFSDVIGYLVLQQLGASYMTGNSMAMGIALGSLDWASVLQRGLPILAFFLGNLLGFLVLTQVRTQRIRSPFAIVFGLELVCLLAFLLLGTHELDRSISRPVPTGIYSVCVVLLTLATGLQTSTIRRVGGQAVRTTFITGVLSDWAQNIVQYLSWLRQHLSEQPVRQTMQKSMQQASFRNILLLASIWGCYVLGAICGGILELHMALFALVFPMFILVVLIVLAVFQPLQ